MRALLKKVGANAFTTALLRLILPGLIFVLMAVKTPDASFRAGVRMLVLLEQNRKAPVQEPDWLAQPAFQQLIARHDQFRPEFRHWRQVISCYAPEIAGLLSTLPGSEARSTRQVESILTCPEFSSAMDGGEVFAPWAGRWSGIWCNGKWQFHTWGGARLLGSQWVQPVTLSESKFVALNRAQAMLARGCTDIAINVYSPQHGITGWVSKVQHGRIEMPHIGYQLNDTTLLWFSQVKHPGQEQQPGQDWLMFLESINREHIPAIYYIQGLVFRLEESGGVQAAPENHSGLYTAQEMAQEGPGACPAAIADGARP